MGGERGIECRGALLGQRRGGSVMDGGRRHPSDSTVTMFVVVPVEELLAVGDRVGYTATRDGSNITYHLFRIRDGMIVEEW